MLSSVVSSASYLHRKLHTGGREGGRGERLFGGTDREGALLEMRSASSSVRTKRLRSLHPIDKARGGGGERGREGWS